MLVMMPQHPATHTSRRKVVSRAASHPHILTSHWLTSRCLTSYRVVDAGGRLGIVVEIKLVFVEHGLDPHSRLCSCRPRIIAADRSVWSASVQLHN